MPVYLDGMIWEATALHSAYPEYLNNNLRNRFTRIKTTLLDLKFLIKLKAPK